MRSQRNNDEFRVITGVERDYKAHRLQIWALQVHDWDEFTRQNRFHAKSHERLCNEVLSLRGPNATSLVDLGCGTGRFLRTLKARSQPPWAKLVAVDFCSEMLNLAELLDTNHSTGVEWLPADLEQSIHLTAICPLTDFDIATAIFVLDEVEDMGAFFASARHVLKPGGRLICAMLDGERERARYHLPASLSDTFTVVRPITIGGHTVPGEYYRLVRPTSMISQAASAVGLTLRRQSTISATELGTREDGPVLRIAIWEKT